MLWKFQGERADRRVQIVNVTLGNHRRGIVGIIDILKGKKKEKAGVEIVIRQMITETKSMTEEGTGRKSTKMILIITVKKKGKGGIGKSMKGSIVV